MKIYLYIRVSSEEQARHGHSLDAQETALKQWAEDNKHDIVGIYRDEGISGRKPYTKRPEMVRLLQDIPLHKPELIVFTKLDRWFRNIKEYYKVQEILDKHKVQWKAIHEDYDTTTSSGRLHVNIMLSVAQDEADRTSERIKAVQRDLVAKGRPISGSVPLGFKIEKIDGIKRIVKNTEEQAELLDLIQHFQTHQSLSLTNKYINAKYSKSRPKVTLKKILRHSLLYGAYNGNEDFTQGYIPKEEYDAIQAILGRNIKQSRTGRIYLFSGLLRCPLCGCSLGGGYDRHNSQRYRCNKRVERRCTFEHTVSEKKVEAYLTSHVLGAYKDYKLDVMKSYKKIRRESPAKYEAQLNRLNEAYIMDNIPQDYYITKTREIKEKIKELTAQEPDIKKHEAVLNSDFLSLYEEMDAGSKRSVWRQLIKSVEVSRDGLPCGIVFL